MRQFPISFFSAFSPLSLPGLAAWYDASDPNTVLTQVGGATVFDSSNAQELSGTDNGQSNLGPGAATFNLWVKAGTLTGNSNFLLNKGFGTSSRAYAISMLSSGVVRVLLYHDGGIINYKDYRTVNAVNDGSWKMITATFSSGVLKLFLNGVELTGANLGKFADVDFSTINQSNATLSLGTTADLAQDETAIWDRDLSGSEITWLYNSGAGRTYAEAPDSIKENLVSWWSMNAPTTGNWLDQHGTNHLTPSVSRPTATEGVTFNVAQDGQTVRRWLDKSGWNRNLDQTVLASQPTYMVNGLNETPVVTFNGANFFSFLGSHTSEWAISLVLSGSGVSGGAIQFGPLNTLGSVFYGSNSWFARKSSSDSATVSYTAAENVILSAHYSSELNSVRIWKNGVLGNPLDPSGSIPEATDAPSSVGRLGAGIYFFTGFIAEIIVINTTATTPHHTRIEKYLSNKWGLAL